jgi:selenium metabolism protein YedF
MAEKKKLLLLVKSSGLGEGEVDLGEKLIKSFFSVLLEQQEPPERMIFVNSGIFLTTAGSPLGDILTKFVEQGTEIFSCGTCLKYYGRQERLIVGKVGDMKETVSSLLEFEKVITL